MQSHDRLHALDAVRAFALLLGIAFHAAISFVPGMPPGIWAMVDNSPSVVLGDLAFVAHIFRVSLFFFIAGFFARMLHARAGGRGFWSNRMKRIAVPLVAGWIVVFPAIAVVWTIGLTKVFGGKRPQMPAGMPAIAGALSEIAQRWKGHLALAIAASAVCLRILHIQPAFTPAQPGVNKLIYVLFFGVALWSWVFGITGFALRQFAHYSPVRRYIADASYWLYIAHLPVVAAFQVWVGHWPLHWSLKYPLVLGASLALLFLSYHFLVRPTFIGELLNGRKYPRR